MNKHLSNKVIVFTAAMSIAVAVLIFFLGVTNHTFCGVRADNFRGMLSIGFGLGCIPFIPGTAGALAGLMFSLYLCRFTLWKQLVAVIVLVGVAIPISEYGEVHFEDKDNSHIVADEVLTFPLATLGLPVHQHPILLASVFITSRILDWTKPPPIGATEAFKGGVGIVLDDVVACLWTLLIFSIGWRWYRHSAKQKLSSAEQIKTRDE
ncbi:phosphatidylglycerophosphatase A [uncultured Methylophaga sp.]|uniref:phosphatidylglycerophosphatase A family protein n=1 Tax=uncultured Methylophaga sp. TaxID=285271 RepID=UPI00262DDDF1|nr:phosphatidylglycerophosphatase A [uncultured Methylophaga sp.]